jgi:hypothetical protein
MKIVRLAWQDKYGLVEGDVVHTVEGDVFGAFERGERVGLLSEVQLLAPCQPTKIVAVGLNYADHAAEAHHEVPAEPLIFLKPPSAVIGPHGNIVYPSISNIQLLTSLHTCCLKVGKYPWMRNCAILRHCEASLTTRGAAWRRRQVGHRRNWAAQSWGTSG